MTNTKNSNESTRFISQMVSYSIGPVAGAVFTFAASTIAAWLISPDNLGKVSLFITAITLLSLIGNLGLSRSYLRDYTIVENKDELLYNCIITSLAFSIILSLIIVAFRYPISIFLFDNADIISTIILALLIPFEIVGEFGVYVCRLRGDTKKYTIAVIVDKASYLVYIVIFYLINVRGYQNIIYARAASIVTKSIVNVLIERDSYHLFGKPDIETIKRSLEYGLPYMPALICSWLLHSMDKYSLRMWSTYTEIGLYTSAYSLISVLAILRTSFSSFWTPLAYKWYDEKKPTKYFEEVGRHITAALTISSAFITLLRTVLYFIYKPEYSSAANIMPFLMFVISMETISYVAGCGINLKKKTIYNSVSTFIACCVNLVGNYLLVPVWGGIGASISTGVSSVVFLVIKIFVSRKLWYRFPIGNYLINTSLIVLMSASAITFNKWWIDLLMTMIIICYNKSSILAIMKICCSYVKKMLLSKRHNDLA